MSPSLQRLLTGLLAGSFLLSLLANIALFRQSRHYERLFYITRLDPLALDRFDGAANPGEGSGTRRIIFFGDSRAAAWPAPALPGTQIVNRGVAGHSSAQALLRFDAHVAPLRPQVIVVQVGVNDLVAVALLRQNRAQIGATTLANIEAIVAKARALGATVVLTTIFPTARALPPRPEVQAAIGAVNRELLGLAGADVRVVDSAALLAGPDGYLLPAYADDELHLSAEGYAALNAALVPLLAEPVD